LSKARAQNHKGPIKQENNRPSEANECGDSVTEKVANWFKDIFNVCGNSSCCGSKQPYYDNKTWDDLNQKISYIQP